MRFWKQSSKLRQGILVGLHHQRLSAVAFSAPEIEASFWIQGLSHDIWVFGLGFRVEYCVDLLPAIRSRCHCSCCTGFLLLSLCQGLCLTCKGSGVVDDRWQGGCTFALPLSEYRLLGAPIALRKVFIMKLCKLSDWGSLAKYFEFDVLIWSFRHPSWPSPIQPFSRLASLENP